MATQLVPREGGRQVSTVITSADQVLDSGVVNASEGSLAAYGQLAIAQAGTVSLRVNGSTANLSQSFVLSGVATPTSGNAANSTFLSSLAQNAEVGFTLIIPRVATGRRRHIFLRSWKTDNAGVMVNVVDVALIWNDTSTAISTIGIGHSVSGGLGVGSEIAVGPR